MRMAYMNIVLFQLYSGILHIISTEFCFPAWLEVDQIMHVYYFMVMG